MLADDGMEKDGYIAIATAQSQPKIEAIEPDNAATLTSNWAIAGAVILASVPHLWKFLSGQQSAQSDLTKTLLTNLTEAHKQSSVSNEAFRSMVESVAERPTELAESNHESLRDLLSEIADLRGQVMKLTQKIDNLATIITRQAQSR
jgi:hypothetical protein